jgi:hypothetical protein
MIIVTIRKIRVHSVNMNMEKIKEKMEFGEENIEKGI